MKPIPSNAHTWVNCTGSVQLSEAHKIPALDTELSESRKEGLAFHELAKIILTSKESTSRAALVGQLSSHGMPYDDDMYDAAVDYATDIMVVYNQAGERHRERWIETKVDTSCVYPLTHGYVDTCVINPTNCTITIWDAKYGYSIVEVFENWQLLTYAFAICESLVNGQESQGWKLVLKVYQPRGFHRDGVMRSWELSVNDARAYFNILTNKARESMGANAKCTTGLHCLNCSANHACDSFRRVNHAIYQQTADAIGTDLTGVSLATSVIMARHAKKLLDGYVKALEEQAVTESRMGKALPGLTAEQGYGSLAWRKDLDQEEVINMGDLMGVELRKPRELKTPTQCKKLLDESVINEYATREVKGWKLVELTEDRVKQMFKIDRSKTV